MIELLFALTGGARAAAPACEALDPAGFRDLSLLLRSGVDRGDDALVGNILAAFDQRLPCLTFAPEPHAWAEVLVLRAVSAYASGGDWQTPLASALHIWPGIDRVVSPGHPLASWEPPEPPPPGPPVPGRARLYVDGLPSETLPPDGVLALVQRTDGQWWNTAVTTPQAPLATGWAEERVVPPPHISTRISASIGMNSAVMFQRPDFESDWVQTVRGTERTAASLGGAADLVVTFYSPLGLLVSGSGWLMEETPGLDLHAAGVWAPRHLLLGAGVGTSSVETLEGPPSGSALEASSGIDETVRRYMLRYPALVARLYGGERVRWQVGLQGGGTGEVRRLMGDAELGFGRGDGGARWLIGLGFGWVQGQFEQEGVGRTLSAGSSRSWIRLGRAWGEGA